MKSHHISEAGVSFENIVWSVYQDMGWRISFLHMAANYRLNNWHFASNLGLRDRFRYIIATDYFVA